MNTPIRRVFYVIAVLFALLAVYTLRWTVIDAKSLRDNSLNTIPQLRGIKQPRGPILTAGGVTIARSEKVGEGTDAFYTRRYPQGSLFAHPAGYSYARLGASGLERYYNDRLTGHTVAVTTVLDSLLGRGGDQQTMQTNLDRGAQRLAESELAGRKGAIVVIDPRTGRVPVYVSVPGYDPAALRTTAGFAALNHDPDSPLVDRVAASTYPPGSTFKVVTATAALDSGLKTPDSLINGDSPKTFSGRPLQNDFNQSFGDITLTDALVNSVNTVFGQLGVDVGKQTLLEYMRRYGFYAPPPLDLPVDELRASGLRDPQGDLLPADAPVDLARVAIGQERLAVTPVQMAEVAATVANKGVRVEPRIANVFTDPYGRVMKRIGTTVAQRVMAPKTAAELNVMMRKVVEEGTGRPAEVAGLNMAGKTGTAEAPGGLNQAWFIGFAPYDDPRYAIAVTIERTDGFGGTVAAPIAAAVLKDLLQK